MIHYPSNFTSKPCILQIFKTFSGQSKLQKSKLLFYNCSKADFQNESNVKSNNWGFNKYKSNTKSISSSQISIKSNIKSNTLMSLR
jgi:hypothetical protein